MRQLRARDLLRGDLERRRPRRATSRSGPRRRRLEKALNWARVELDVPGDLRPRLLRDRDDVDGHRPLRHRPLRGRGVPRLAAPGGHADPLGPGLDQDGPGRPPRLRPDARAEVGDLDGRLLVLGRACSPTTPSSRAPTSSCRSTSTSPAARRGRRRCSTASPSCSGRSWATPTSAGARRYNAVGTEEWARDEAIPPATRRSEAAEAAYERGAGEERPSPMPDAPGLELIAGELARTSTRAACSPPTTSTAGACLIVDPEQVLDGARLAARHPRPGVPLPRQRPRRRLPAGRAALRRPLRAPEPRPGRADPGARPLLADPGDAGCRRSTPASSCSRPPSSRSARSTTSSGSSSAATRTCAGSCCPRTTSAGRSAATSRSAASR